MDRVVSEASTQTDKHVYRYRFGEVEFDEARFDLRVRGLNVELERKPLLVLLELLRRADEVVKRQELLQAAWNGRVTVNHALSNCVLKLRKALGPIDGERIVTVSKGGYRFVGVVERSVVGRRSISTLDLKSGQIFAGRQDYRLERQLGESFGNEVWLARSTIDGTAVVFKFNRHGESLRTLKRETKLYRYLIKRLGPRADFASLRYWNFEAPPFYIESDYCGENLAQWAAIDNQLKALRLEERLNLFLQIADAVAAAHSVAILHKDLKPTNIFMFPLDTGFQVKVGDFGNSSMLEPERLEELGFTGLGKTIAAEAADVLSGTPLYLAPELLAGGVATIRSDVYALGLLLWQLVAAADFRRPMASGWQHEIDDPLLEEDILLATAGDPQRRLSSVVELTTRLRNRGERGRMRAAALTAEKRAVAAAKALEKAKARKPWIVTSLIVLALGLSISLMLYRNERIARLQSQVAERRAETINMFLTDMLQSADPATPGGAIHTTIASAIDRAQLSLKRVFGYDPDTKGSIDLTLGNTFSGLGDYRKALIYHQEAFALLTTAFGTNDPRTLTAAYRLAVNLDMVSRHQEATALLDSADHAAGPLLSKPSQLSFLARSARGGHFLLQMRAAPALDQFLITEQIRTAVDPNNAAWLIHMRADIAWCEVRLDRSAEALQSLAGLMSTDYSPQEIGILEWMKLHLQYGIALSNLGRFSEAESVLKSAESEAEKELGPSAYLVGLAYNYLAAEYKSAGNWNAAAEAADNELRIWIAAVGPTHQSSLAALVDKVVIDYLKSPGARTVAEIRNAHETLSRMLGSQSPFSEYARFYLADALLQNQYFTEAARLASDLDPLDIASADISPDWSARVQALRGRLMLAGSDKIEGARLLKSAVKTLVAHGAQPWIVQPLQRALQEALPL